MCECCEEQDYEFFDSDDKRVIISARSFDEAYRKMEQKVKKERG
jgi:hypothetical protein